MEKDCFLFTGSVCVRREWGVQGCVRVSLLLQKRLHLSLVVLPSFALQGEGKRQSSHFHACLDTDGTEETEEGDEEGEGGRGAAACSQWPLNDVT